MCIFGGNLPFVPLSYLSKQRQFPFHPFMIFPYFSLVLFLAGTSASILGGSPHPFFIAHYFFFAEAPVFSVHLPWLTPLAVNTKDTRLSCVSCQREHTLLPSESLFFLHFMESKRLDLSRPQSGKTQERLGSFLKTECSPNSKSHLFTPRGTASMPNLASTVSAICLP